MQDSLRIGERTASPHVAIELQSQIVALRIEQGRAGEIEEAARALVQRFPDAHAWRAGLARILVSTGRVAEAHAELERLARARFADVARDRGWLPTLALASEVAFATGDARSAGLLEPLLAPYARLAVVMGSGLVFYGPVAHHLGLLAATRAQWDAAIERFETALAMEERAGARIWQARTRLACARALLGRNGRGDRAHAVRLGGDVLAAARRLGLGELARAAHDLEATLWAAGRGAPAARVQTRSGDSEG